MQAKQTTTLVATVNEQIVGMIGFGQGRQANLPPFEIYALNVLPRYQGQKIGSRLLQAALADLDCQQGVYLRVAVENTAAQHFYQRLGFRHSQQREMRTMADFQFEEWIFLYP